MTENPTIMLVVAAALEGTGGRWLMHKRPQEKQHGGLWEFPGGKVEPGETPQIALIRELEEELAIQLDPEAVAEATFASSSDIHAGTGIVILLYSVTAWEGDPRPLEGGELGWFTADEIISLDKPPLDIELAMRFLRPLA